MPTKTALTFQRAMTRAELYVGHKERLPGLLGKATHKAKQHYLSLLAVKRALAREKTAAHFRIAYLTKPGNLGKLGGEARRRQCVSARPAEHRDACRKLCQ